MSKKKKKNSSHTIYYILIGVFLICSIVFLYDKYSLKKIKGSYDIKTSVKYDIIPKDTIIKSYEEYTLFLKNNLTKIEYKNVMDTDKLNKDTFKENDYLALFYESRMCPDKVSYPNSMSQLKTKVILSVTRYESSKCELVTRISFIPVEKDKYETMPNVVVEKKIIKK